MGSPDISSIMLRLHFLHLLVFSFQCPDGLLFNSEQGLCDWPDNVDCNNQLNLSESSTSSSTVVVTTSQITSTTTTGISPVTAATLAFKPVSAETTTSISTETSSSTSTEWLSSSCSSPSAEPITPELEKLRKSSCSISNLIVEKIKAGRTSNPINVKIVE